MSALGKIPARFSARFILCALAVLFSIPGRENALGQTSSSEHMRYLYRVQAVETPPVMDGDLSDTVWQQADIINQFIQQQPDYGQPASQKTEVRLISTSDALFVGVYCYEDDSAETVRSTLRFRDDLVWRKDDVIRIVLDTFHDHRRTYVFATNALETKQDAQIDNEVWHTDWDEVWEVRTRLHENGWSAEFRIPFRILQFPLTGDGMWGYNVERIIMQRNERSYWAPIPPGVPLARPAAYGHLEGLEQIRPKKNMQFIPYGLAGSTWSRPESNNSSTFEVGGDMKLGLTSSLSLDATYNTNFAQVEADDQQINLTRFPLFFPEKREFFLENAQLFAYGVPREAQLFFSRRIGLTEEGAVPILAGARLSGTAGPVDLGLLTTQTEKQEEQQGVTTPSTNFSAARFRWNVMNRSYIGGILTSVSSESQGNRIFGPDALFWLGRYLRWEGFGAMQDDRKIGGNPLTYSTAVIYNDDLWEVNLRTLRVDAEFRPALGFIQRQGGFRRQRGLFRRGWRLNRDWARKIDFSAQHTYLTDRDGILDTRQWVWKAANELDNGDNVFFQAEHNFERLTPRERPFVVHAKKGVVVPPGDYPFNRWTLGYQGFQGRPWLANVEVGGGDFYSGDRKSLALSGSWRASPHLALSADYEFNDITLPQASFGTHLWRGRFSVPFNARTTADAFFQWNGLDEEFSMQLRFHLIYADDSNAYIVFTDERRDIGGGIIERDRALQAKITYRFFW